MRADTRYTSEDMMTIAAARRFRDRATCFVGVGLPSAAACLARRLQAPDAILVYESGAIGAKPKVPPLSVADPELADTAVVLASMSDVFRYWLQGGRIDIGFLGAGQIDRFGNINSTVIGDYKSPKVRMPGAGGAPHITANVKEIVVIVRHAAKTLVPRLDFLTTARCTGPVTLVTDLGILEAQPEAGELVLSSLHPGVGFAEVREATGWTLREADRIEETPEPTEMELAALRELHEDTRTRRHKDRD
jgi:glutaconate CoA-transferase subunit B